MYGVLSVCDHVTISMHVYYHNELNEAILQSNIDNKKIIQIKCLSCFQKLVCPRWVDLEHCKADIN